MMLSEQDVDSLTKLTMPIVDDIDEVMTLQISGFNAELTALISRIHEIQSRSVDLTYITELDQLHVLRERLVADSFRVCVDAVRIAECRLELLSSLDERARVLVKLAKHRLETAVAAANAELQQSGLTRKEAEARLTDIPEVAEAIQLLRRVRTLPSRFRSELNCCPEVIAAFIDDLGEKLQRWANEFVGLTSPA